MRAFSDKVKQILVALAQTYRPGQSYFVVSTPNRPTRAWIAGVEKKHPPSTPVLCDGEEACVSASGAMMIRRRSLPHVFPSGSWAVVSPVIPNGHGTLRLDRAAAKFAP